MVAFAVANLIHIDMIGGCGIKFLDRLLWASTMAIVCQVYLWNDC